MVKPGYKQTEIGVIPEDWETSSLSAAFQKLEAGVSVNSDNSLSSEYHILKTSAVHDGVVDTAETKPVIPQDYLRLKCPLVKGSIIISRMNTPALVGECGFTKDAKAGTYLPDRLWQIQNFNKSSFDFVWLNYLLNTKQYRDAVRATATGTSNSMKNISKERMLDIEIPRPPINEQENIAAALSEVDELINLVEKQIDKKKAIKQGAMQELLTGKRRLPGFFGEWVNTKIGSITEVYSGGTPNTSEPAFWGGKIPWMNSGELNLKIVRQVQGRITEVGMDSSSTHFIPAECVLIGLAGQGKTRGTAAFNTFPLCTNQSIAAIYPNPNKFDSKFLYYKMDIIFDFATKARLMDGNGNAILVAGSVYSACRYYEIFQSKGFRKCAIISSYTPQAGDLRTDTVSDEEETETFEKYSTYLKMIGVDPSEDKTQIAKKVEAFEAEAKRKFVDEPANMKLLIVVDKLLTGFDAPSCTYLYIDKAMHDHGLFQAICRVNRLDGESKDFGYIVDYKELFGDLADAMNKYTAGAFESYDAEDVDGLLKDRATEAKKYFVDTLEELDELCEGVELPRKELDYIHYFRGESGRDENQDEAFARIREKLYKLVGRLIRAFAELKPRMTDLGYTLSEQSALDDRVAFYVNMRDTIGRASGDFIDLKAYEPGMRYLIDNYISASESQKIGSMDDFTLLDFIISQENKLKSEQKGEQESAAETIENNIRKKVVERMVINPAYYAKMSEILEQ